MDISHPDNPHLLHSHRSACRTGLKGVLELCTYFAEKLAKNVF
jgi:hypothetical protein